MARKEQQKDFSTKAWLSASPSSLMGVRVCLCKVFNIVAVPPHWSLLSQVYPSCVHVFVYACASLWWETFFCNLWFVCDCLHTFVCVCFFLCVFMCLLGRNCCEWERRGILLAQGMIGFYWAPNWHWHHHSTWIPTLWGKSSSSEASSFGSSCHGISLKLIFVAHVLFWVANFRRANWMFNDHVVDTV